MNRKMGSLVKQNKDLLCELEQLLRYRFTDLRLLQQALIHSSFAFEQNNGLQNNERLEFLGDAVLDLVIGNILYKRYATMKEGELTKLRAALVNESHLAAMARSIELGRFLCLGKGEEASNGSNKSSILSCAYESVTGAIFEDGGYDTVAECLEQLFLPAIEGKKEELLIGDAKSRLQEILQNDFNEAPCYRLDGEEGPSHKKNFTVSVIFREDVLGSGTAGSKKEAEQRAATAALNKISG